MEDLTGKQFGQYRIVAPLGEGGMADVYRAYQASIDRYVAIKVLPQYHSRNREFLDRFKQEGQVLAKLQHPFVVPILDFGEADGYTYLVMTFIEGGTLNDLLTGSPIPLSNVEKIISQIGSALEYAHSLGMVHRDIKPSNILIDQHGNCLLTDFGVAKILEGSAELTRTGGILGTPAYMSPEQGLGEKIEHTTDIYSLGVVLYEMVTGRAPFQAETPFAVIYKHIHDPLPPPSSLNPEVPEGVERVILKSLAKDPKDRYQSVRSMTDALSAATPVEAPTQELEQELIPTEVDLVSEPAASPPAETTAGKPPSGFPDMESRAETAFDKEKSPSVFKKVLTRNTILLLGIAISIAIAVPFALDRFDLGGADRGDDATTQEPPQAPATESVVSPNPTEEEIEEQVDDIAESPLVIGTTDSWTSFESAWVYTFHDWELSHQCADGLLNFVPGSAGEIYPALAESFEVSDDGQEYVFHLRQGVVFPNGDPFDADAVLFSLERIEPINATEGENAGFLFTRYAESVEKIDNFTVKIIFNAPYPFAPQLVATNVWKIHNPNEWSGTEAGSDNTSCGIGPYLITSFTEGEEIIFERNETYYGEPAETDKIVVRYFADSPTMALALQNGEIDIAWKSLSPADQQALAEAEGITIKSAGSIEIRYLVYNATTPPFDNPDVRLGLAQLLDREQLTDLGWQGNKIPLYSMVPPGLIGHKPTYEGTEDVEAGKALLATAGFNEENPLVMDLWYSPTHYGDTEADVATVLKRQWEASGIVQVRLQFFEWAAFREAGRGGQLPVSLLGWYPDILDPDNYTNVFAHSPASWSGSNYNNPEMDALLDAQAVELDEATRISILEDIQDLWVLESPFVPLAQGKLFLAHRDEVSGVVLDQLALLHYFLLRK